MAGLDDLLTWWSLGASLLRQVVGMTDKILAFFSTTGASSEPGDPHLEMRHLVAVTGIFVVCQCFAPVGAAPFAQVRFALCCSTAMARFSRLVHFPLGVLVLKKI
jgi:hypothetical protein